jgi:small subunit ribosomal protein S16
MPARIRLQRKGKKGRPFYHIVIADGRAPRDGKFIERIGIYNSIAKPAEIDLDIEKALYWLQAGAVPTDTVRALLSFKGVMYKYHLLKGVRKGAMTEEQAEMKFQEWIREKQEKLLSRIREQELETKDERKKRMANEVKVNETRAKELAAKREKELKAAQKHEAQETTEEAVEETPVAEVIAEEVIAEEAVAEEAVAEEAVAEEAVAEEIAAVDPEVTESTDVNEVEPVATESTEAEPTSEA